MTRFSVWLLSGGVAALAPASGMAMAMPDSQPRIFAPAEISATTGIDCATFSADGKTVLFRQGPWSDGMIMESHKANGHWSMPTIASFSGAWLDHDPAVAPDGSFAIYTTNRPDTADGKPLFGGHLWRVDRVGSGWGKPVRLPDVVNFGSHIFAPSIAGNADLYFQSTDNPTHQFHLYRSTWHGGRYQKPERLELMPDGMHELDPAIAPDQSFIVFDAGKNGSTQPDHLYIAFRENDGWSTAVDLGDAIDAYQPWGAHLGPDGTTVYFTGNHSTKAQWPRTRAQAEQDLAQMRAWDNGTSHIYSVSLQPWLAAHRDGKDAPRASTPNS